MPLESSTKNSALSTLAFVVAVAACWLACAAAARPQSPPAPALRLPAPALSDGLPASPAGNRELSAASLSNGTEFKSRLRLDGSGELKIANGTAFDAIVNVVEPRTRLVVRSFFVQSGKSFVEKNLAPDTYDVYFSTGKDWNSKSRLFEADAYYGRLERQIWFYEKVDPLTGRTQYRGYEVTLQAVEGGDSVFLPVDPATFQALMNQSSDSAQLAPHSPGKNQPNSN